MGMFDHLSCEVKLPDGFRPDDWFQTKSFPDCGMRRFTITARGKLRDDDDNDLQPEGYITFYAADRTFPDEHKQHWREYRAEFVRGRLKAITRVRGQRFEQRHYGLASFKWFRLRLRPLKLPDLTRYLKKARAERS